MTSPLPYIGGKSRLAKDIISRFPEHETYCEAFAGAAWVFFTKEPGRFEVINDLDDDLVAFYRVLQYHLNEFAQQFKFLLASRTWFEDYKRQAEAGGLTDIQRAARYYYLQRLCFGGRPKGRVFGTGPMHRPRINLIRLEEGLSDAHLRLANATIEHLPWDQFVVRYDRPGTFFYLDPPYYLAPYYRHNFVLPDFERMADVLAGVKGKFLLSINDMPEMREVFKRFNIEAVSLKYSAAKNGATVGRELLIRNY